MHKQLTADEREQFRSEIAAAAYHLAECWDALRTAEEITGLEIETDDISSFAGDVEHPARFPEIDDIDLDELLDRITPPTPTKPIGPPSATFGNSAA